MTLPLPNPAMNVLERWLWYADRLEEAGVLYDPRADVRELARAYRATYEPVVALEVRELVRILRETTPSQEAA